MHVIVLNIKIVKLVKFHVISGVPKTLTREHTGTLTTPVGDLITMADQDVDILNNIITGY
jgi:hypothetical protein